MNELGLEVAAYRIVVAVLALIERFFGQIHECNPRHLGFFPLEYVAAFASAQIHHRYVINVLLVADLFYVLTDEHALYPVVKVSQIVNWTFTSRFEVT